MPVFRHHAPILYYKMTYSENLRAFNLDKMRVDLGNEIKAGINDNGPILKFGDMVTIGSQISSIFGREIWCVSIIDAKNNSLYSKLNIEGEP